MSQEQYTLYDIPTKDGAYCWSPNTWKARAILNVKRVPYKTVWVEYPDIKPTLESFEIKPLDDDPPYTLPLLQIDAETPAGGELRTYLRDSADILAHINARYPDPVVDLDGPINQVLSNVKHQPGPALTGLIITVVPDYLSERSAEYFHRTREAKFGMTLAKYREKAIEEGAWKTMEDWVHEIRGLLRENGGPFFAGEKLSLIDIRLLGFLKWFEVTGKPEDWKKIQGFGGEEFDKFYSAAKGKFAIGPDGVAQ